MGMMGIWNKKKIAIKEVGNSISEIFKMNDCDEISIINKNSEMQNIDLPITNHPNIYQESYGL